MSANEFLTLSDIQQQSDNLLKNAIIQVMRKKSVFLDKITIETTGTMHVKNMRAGKINKTGNRKIGEMRPIVMHEKPDVVEDAMYIYSNRIQIPTQNVDFKDKGNLYDPVAWNIEATTTSIARQITSDMINNTPTANPDALVGFKWRVDNSPMVSEIKIPASGTNGTALDLDPSGANYQQNIRQFKRILDTAKDVVAEGAPDFILCNNTFINMQSSIWADSNYLKTTEDSLHRVFQDWDGVQYLDMGNEDEDMTSYTKVIKDYETAYGVDGTAGTDHCTSIYLVKMGEEFWQMVQAESLNTSELYKDADRINYRVDFDWEIGHMITHPRSVVRLYGLKMA